MHIEKIIRWTRNLMDKYELNHWSISTSHRKSFAGCCRCKHNKITMSSHDNLTQKHEELIVEVILHEIAHAIICDVVFKNKLRTYDNIQEHGKEFDFVCQKITLVW